MPSSEQEMRDRARKYMVETYGALADRGAFTVNALFKHMADFALLERAEARRETIEECAKVAEHEQTSCLSPQLSAYGHCGRIASALRAKLTPAPEAEKEGKI